LDIIEREQWDKNRSSLEKRLTEISQEIELETTSIKGRFANLKPRLFPLAITYLISKYSIYALKSPQGSFLTR